MYVQYIIFNFTIQKKNNLLSEDKYRFCVGRATSDANTDNMVFVNGNLYNGNVVFYFFKAFNGIHHSNLLVKLDSFCKRGVAKQLFK